MASTRIYPNVKIGWRAFNTESTNSTPTVLLAWLTVDATKDKTVRLTVALMVMVVAMFVSGPRSFATTKGLSQIVTPDLQPEGDLSLSFQIQDKRIANLYQLQAELGLTQWAEAAVFRGFQPDEWIFGTEIGLLRKEPYLLSIGFVNWSPHLDEESSTLY
jgi:hypothetical protein